LFEDFRRRAPVETDPMRMCELLVGLPDVRVLGIDDSEGQPLRILITTKGIRPGCPYCGVVASLKDYDTVEYIDLPVFGRPAHLVWRKRRFECRDPDCPKGSWTEEDPRIAAPRQTMTDRAGRWVTEQVGRFARTVAEVARELGCDWHTVNDTAVSYGEALVDDPGRYDTVRALGMDEVLFVRRGTYHAKEFTTQLVDVESTQLLDIVPGRSGEGPKTWLDEKSDEWKQAVRVGTLDMSGPYRAVFSEKLAHVTQVADPFHVVKHANSKLDECRRRVQNETLGHRGRKDDPLYRCRRLLTKAHERLDERGENKLVGLLAAGDPKGEVTTAWHAKEAVRQIYSHHDAELARQWVDELIDDMKSEDKPPEVQSLARTLTRWKGHILAWHTEKLTNGPTEAANNLVKRVKRTAFGFRSFRNYRVRSLLYAGKPNWDLLATVIPR
jgi:transposase